MAVLVTDNDPYSGQWRAAESRANIDARLDKLLQVAGLDHNVLSDTRKRETIYHFAEAYDEAIKSIRKSRKKSVLAERSAQTIPDSEAAFRPTVKPKPAGLKHRAPPPIPNSSSTIPKPLPPLPTVSSGHVRAEETDSEISLHYLRRQRDQIFQNSGFSSSNPGNGNHYLYDSKSKRAAQYWQQSDVENSETQPGSVSLPTTIPSFAKDLSDSVNQRAPQVESLARRQIVNRDPPPAVYPKPKRNVTRGGIPTELTIARSVAPRYSPPTRDLKHAPLVQAPYPDRLSLILKQILDEETYASISKPTDEVFTCDKPIPTKPFDPVQPSNDTSLQPVSAASSQHQTPTLLNAKLTGLFETAAFDSNTPTCQSSKIGPFDGNVTTEPRDNSYQQDTSAKSQHNTLNFLNAKPTGLFMASAFSSNTKTFQNSKTGPFDGNVTTEPSDNPCQQDTSKTSHHQALHFLNAKPTGLYVPSAFNSNRKTIHDSKNGPFDGNVTTELRDNSYQQDTSAKSRHKTLHFLNAKPTGLYVGFAFNSIIQTYQRSINAPFDGNVTTEPSDNPCQQDTSTTSHHQTLHFLNAKPKGLYVPSAFNSNKETFQDSKTGPFDGNAPTEPSDSSYQQDAQSQHKTPLFLNARPTGLYVASVFNSNTQTFQDSKIGPFDGNVTTEPSDNPCQQDTSKTSHHQAQHFLNAKPNGLYVAPAFISNSQTSPNSRADPTPTNNSFQQVVTESSQTQSPHLIKDKTTRPHAAAHPDPKPQTCQKTKPSPKAPKDIPKIRTQPSTSVITALTDPATPPFLNANTNWSSRIAVIDPTTPPFLNSKPVLHIPFYPLEKSNHFVYDTQPDQFIGAASPAVHLDKLEPQISVLPNHISPVPNATTNPTSSPATLPKIFPPISLSTSDITQHDPITTNDPTSSLATPPESFSPISLSTSDPNPHVPISTTDPPLALLPKRFSHVSLSTSDPNPHVPISTTDPPPALPPKRSSPNPLASISPAFYPSLPPKKYLHNSMSTLNQTSSSENFNKPNSVTSGKKKAKDGHYSIPGPPIPVYSKTAKSVPVNHYKPLPPLHAASAKSICHYAIPGPPIPVSNYIPTNSLLHNGNPVTLNHVARIKPSLRANHTDQCAKQSLLESGAAPAPSRDLHGETEAHKPMAFPLRKDAPPNDAKLAQTAAARIEAAASVEAAIHADAATHHKEATHVESAIHVKAAANVQAAQHRCALPPRPKPPLRAALLDRSRYPKRNHYYKTVFAVTYAYMVVLRMARF